MDDTVVEASKTWTDYLGDWILWINIAIAVYWLIGFVTAVIVTRKAGYSGWLGVLIIGVPFVGPFIMLVALLKWPLERERDRAVDALEKAGGSLEPAHAKDEIEEA